ncbi:MAG: hypothetical protein OXB93_00050 [Cytophagales bacterium]|nr:hypothetical protein [Cytophagales bacterium]
MRKNISPTESGKAWEYGLAKCISNVLDVPFMAEKNRDKGQVAYDGMGRQKQKR